MPDKILIITTDALTTEIAHLIEKRLEPEVERVDSFSEALQLISKMNYRFLITDSTSLGTGALPLFKRLNRIAPLTDLILLAPAEIDLGEAIVDNLIDRSLTLREIVKLIGEAIELRSLLDRAGIIGHSQNLKEIAKSIRQVAPTDISVLITGASGTGKELVARAIHENSPRAEYQFVSINCASIPEQLLESELFGYRKGAFTGAAVDQDGLLIQAERGTLFLDEIGEMDQRLQAKLLRAIETKSFLPVGARKPVNVDIRFIAATNRDLYQEVNLGRFRADLYYRLGVINMELQRLSERPEDILPIIAFYLNRVNGEIGFSPAATNLLLKYGWPGNIRELTNFLQRLIITSPEGEVDENTVHNLLDIHISEDRNLPVATGLTTEESGYRLVYHVLANLAKEISELKQIILERYGGLGQHEVSAATMSEGVDLEDMEEKLIRETIAQVNGNRRRAAKLLGIGERTLYRKLKKYNIE